MHFQILEVILWPRKLDYAPRRLPFQKGVVNVISGASRTGKSAIIPIIDYCLGSGKCRIPVLTIRDSCEWFGILIDTSEGRKLLARKSPGNQLASRDMYILEGSDFDIPRKIDSKNINVNDIKLKLDELSLLTNLDFDVEQTNISFKGRPSFRDFAPFIFQPQNIVANPEVLFYKTDTYEHREKLRTIFPYVLNAVDAQLLAKQHQLYELRKTLLRKKRELDQIRQVSERWKAEIRSKADEAHELNLIKSAISPSAEPEDLIELLKQAVNTFTDQVTPTFNTIDDSIQELSNLTEEESQLSTTLMEFRKRYQEMTSLRQSVVSYKNSLKIQRDRLEISNWLRSISEPDQICPICKNELTTPKHQLESLVNSLNQIELSSRDFDTIPPAFDREYERTKSDIKTTIEKLEAVRLRKNSLLKSSDEASNVQYISLRVSRFIGNLEQAIETYSHLGKDSQLSKEVEDLERDVDILQKEINASGTENKLKIALNKISEYSGSFILGLDTERPSDLISLSINDLTIKVRGQQRDDYLWEIGSGSNWVSYHIAVSLSLQQYFMELDHSPIPSFIIYDQPSQVYFPKRMYPRSQDELDPELKDEDIEAVRKIFQTFSVAVRKRNGDLQIIVLDHASDNIWGNIENVHLVEEWRMGEKLVPEKWLS